ncbi:MAG TPA: hypothetical protein VMB35_01945 [Methanomicrobiales archaeon]|nr:hypothetical protein [Methanomicrobiales archaeon]
MNERIRQMILGLGTFGTGTALLYTGMNPVLLVLTDTVVGIGMLFAAGSLKMEDLRIRSAASAREVVQAGTVPEAPGGLRASLGRMRSLRPSRGAAGEPAEAVAEAEKEKIDLMLDSALVGQSRKIISLAEGRPKAVTPVQPAAKASPAGAKPAPGAVQGEGQDNPFDDLTGVDIPAQLLEEVSGEETAGAAGALAPVAGTPGPGDLQAAAFPQPGEEPEPVVEPPVNVLTLADGGLGADDLLSALRAEAMREKRRDDTSLLRDLKGVRVSGKQLLDELGDVLHEMRGR